MIDIQLAPRRRTTRRLVVGAVLASLIPIGPLQIISASAQSAAEPVRSSPVTLRIQLHGSGFEDPTGFAPEFHGTMGGFGSVEARLKGEPDSQSTVLGISDGKIRVRAPGRFSFRTTAGTIEGSSVALLALPVDITPAGPVPSSTAFIDIEERITVTGGTGRFRNTTGTMVLRGILPEIRPVGGKRRFVVELSGEALLQLDPSAG